VSVCLTEIHAVNEYCEYLAELVNDIAMQLKTAAVCCHIHHLRHGHLTIDDALLPREWQLAPILNNMRRNRRHLTFQKLFTRFGVGGEEAETEAGDVKLVPGELLSAREMLDNYNKRKVKDLGHTEKDDVSGSNRQRSGRVLASRQKRVRNVYKNR